MRATAIVFFDDRRAKKDNTYPISIKITHNRIRKYYPTKYSLTEKEYEKVMSKFRLTKDQQGIVGKLDALILKANTIIEDLEPFTFEAFDLRFTTKGNKSDLLFLLAETAGQLRKGETHANANLYQQAAKLLSRYNATVTKSTELPLISITPKWLQAFERWVIKQGYSPTTIGMYLIRVRAIFNEAITNREFNDSLYPFHRPNNKGGYKIPKGANNKRALTKPEIMQIYHFVTDNHNLQFARDIFLFSFLASGMNCCDIWRLKWSDIEGDTFSFIRKKTEGKAGGANKITIPINQDIREIIERHGSRKIGNDYVFNVINPNMTALEEMSVGKRMTTYLNSHLKKIALELGLTDKISTYFSRHSFATISMNSERSPAYIQKQLGHTSLLTTQNYLGSFADDKLAEYQEDLLDKKVG